MSFQASDTSALTQITEQIAGLLEDLTWSEDSEMHLIDAMIAKVVAPEATLTPA